MLDLIAPRSQRRFFSGGWGPRPALDSYREILGTPPPRHDIPIRWGRAYFIGGLWNRDGTYLSPHPYLPDEARRGRLRLQWRQPLARRVCVLFAATNEHGYSGRSRIGRYLTKAGVAAAIIENPFYGARRVAGGRPHTVYDALVMGRAAVEEGIGLVQTLSQDFLVGVSGYSMGGSVASVVSAGSSRPVATAAIGASHSPAPVFTEGVLAQYVDWHALGGRSAWPDLATTLGAASTLRLPSPPHSGSAILALARHDAYVPAHSVIDLHRHWQGSELRWVTGGHASMHFRARAQAEIITEAFDRFSSGSA